MSTSTPPTASVTFRSVISILLFQIIFYGVLFAIAYWIITINWIMLGICAVTSLLQITIKKVNEGYFNFVLEKMGPQEYFQMTRHYSQSILESEKTMFTYHPHSIFCYGVLTNMNRKQFAKQKLTYAIPLGSRFVLSLPLIGLHFRMWGFQSVDPTNLKNLLTQGKDVSLVPGGFEEATLTTPDEFRVFVKNRKGFVKYALKYGYTLRPVLITNQHKAMWTFDGLKKLRLLFNKIKIPGTVFWGKYGLLFPPGVIMHTLIGKGIKAERVYEKGESPSEAEIDRAHKKYVDEVTRMYEEHKQKNGNTPFKIY